MRIKILAAVCLAALSTSALAVNFSAPVVTAGPNSAMAIGDVNGDQLDDLVADDAILLQRADGSLGAPLHYPYPHNFDFSRTLVDLNRDGTLDIANCSDNGVQLLSVNASTGQFAEVDVPVTDAAGRTWTCKAIAALDLNRDGNPDLVALAADDDQIVFLYGDGHGRISSTVRQTLPQKAYRTMATGDVTGDGLADVVLVGEALDVYPGTGTGGLGPVRTSARYDPSHLQEGVAIGDVNSDGRNDVVVTEYANWPNTIVAVYAQASNGTLPYTPAVTATADLPRKTLIADLDHNGHKEVLVAHESTFGIGMLAGTPGGLEGEIPIAGQPTDPSYMSDYEVAVGDLNDDGCADVIGADYYYSNRYFFAGNGCDPRKVTADFDGDGKSDLVWRNSRTGANVIWRAADSARTQAVATLAVPAWQIAGSGDFNGDHRADLVWRNLQTGANAIWLSGNSATPRTMPGVTSLDWQIVGIGDFDGDGLDDVLWRNRATGANTVWKAAWSGSQLSVGALAVQWTAVGVGDFDGDHRADILWRNGTTGADMVWPGANAAASRPITGVTNLAWTVAGVGDFDGDGRADIFWRNASTGANTIWRAGNLATPMTMAAVTGSWTVVVGDYNGDGKSDVLWRNSTTGVDVLWRAAQMKIQLPVTDVSDVAWKAIR
jgi:hypothetical protein